MNMGYPLLSEMAQLDNSSAYIMRGEEKVEGECWKQILPPEPQKPETCYRHYYEAGKQAFAQICNPKIGKGLRISFDPADFPCLVQWNKFSCRDYALGLEPRSTRSGGRAKSREKHELYCLGAGESRTYRIRVDFFDGI